MNGKKSLALAGLAALLVMGAESARAEVSPDPTTPKGVTKRYNTNGAEFGSDVELGKSGSTPGIILGRTEADGTYRAAAAGTTGGGADWGLLGLLGLVGLASRFRRREQWNA